LKKVKGRSWASRNTEGVRETSERAGWKAFLLDLDVSRNTGLWELAAAGAGKTGLLGGEVLFFYKLGAFCRQDFVCSFKVRLMEKNSRSESFSEGQGGHGDRPADHFPLVTLSLSFTTSTVAVGGGWRGGLALCFIVSEENKEELLREHDFASAPEGGPARKR